MLFFTYTKNFRGNDLLQCYRRSLSNDHEAATMGQYQIAKNLNTSQPCSCFQGQRTFLEGIAPGAEDCSRSCGKISHLDLLVYCVVDTSNSTVRSDAVRIGAWGLISDDLQ